MVVKQVKEVVKELVILDERIVMLDANDAKGGLKGAHVIDLDMDSYVICFTGRRGGGKTTMLTFYSVLAWKQYRRQIVSNFPIEFKMRRFRSDGKSYLEHVKSEPFDFERLILDTDAYKNSIIILDEAPDLISHMAASSQKNKLMDAWSRQIRKNGNSLFMGAQSMEWIDKSMRWQVDIEIECKDVSRALGYGSGLPRGALIQVTYYDNSGQWTDTTYYELRSRYEVPWSARYHITPGVLFGDDTHFPVFDSWATVDILESFRKVELRMSKIKMGDRANAVPSEIYYDISQNVLKRALDYINMTKGDDISIAHFQKHLFESIGAGEVDKNNFGKLLSKFNVMRGREEGSGQRWYAFQEFDYDGFEAYVKKSLGEGA